ncbi:outer membrane protein assembly factor BamA [Bacteroidales bacterium 6E]|nr:outer membrane protein assembly factor BamA [Bacteroidales bacterium 6E]
MHSRHTIILLLILILLSFTVRADKPPTVKSIRFTGNVHIEDGRLEEQMNTREKSFMQRLTFWKPGLIYNPVILEDDISRITGFYARNGFPAVSIQQSTSFVRSGKRAVIDIEISEGKPVRIGEVNWTELSDSVTMDILGHAMTGFPLEKGQIFRDHEVFAAENKVVKSFSDQGFPLARISRNLNLDSDTSFANIRFKIEPGPFIRFGDIQVVGDSLVPESYIRQNITLKPGQIFSIKEMDKTQMKLVSLDLFRFITVRALTDSMVGNRVPVVIRINEMPRWSVRAGAGYGTEDKQRFSLNVMRRSFLGGARKLILSAKHSYYEPIDISLKFIQPNFPFERIDMSVSPFYLHQKEQSFEVMKTGAGITFQHALKGRSSVWLNLGMERNKVEDKSSDGNLKDLEDLILLNNKAGITLGTMIDKANDMFDPVRGYKISSQLTLMGPDEISDYSYYKFMADGSKYLQIGSGMILAARLKTGIIMPLGKSGVTPIEDRFLAGGANSLRGWARNRISPLDESGNQLGGDTMFESGIEVRFPVYDIFGAAVFMEAGNVWREAYKYDFRNMRYDIGAGLRIKTPIGPARIDFATPVFEGKPQPHVFITIGHAF